MTLGSFTLAHASVHVHVHVEHKYALVPPLVGIGSWKHIKCHCRYLHLTVIGSAWSRCTTGSEIFRL